MMKPLSVIHSSPAAAPAVPASHRPAGAPVHAGRRRHGRARGFTLIELMIVVAVIGVLGAIALPSYGRYVQRAHRADAKTALLDLAAREQRYFSTHNAYSSDPSVLGFGAGATAPISVPNATSTTYQVAIVIVADPPSFTLTATPNGSQANDACANFTYNSFGQRGISGTGITTNECWQK